MDPSIDKPAFPHDAFISYSRKDIDFARILEKTLEAYSPPKELGLPQKHLDVFRDEGDFTGVDYDKAIQHHLVNSRKLLVVCSPNARTSKYVDDEIRRFSQLRGADHIIPILLSGIPNNEAKTGLERDMAFPAALCEVMSMPLATAYRDFKCGRDKVNKGLFDGSWFTILANLYEVSRSEIEQREKKRQARNRRIRNAVITGVGAALALLAAWALVERDVAIRRANLVLARQLATESSSMQLQQSWDSLVIGVLLAAESVDYAPTAEGFGALRKGASLLPIPPESIGRSVETAWGIDATGKVLVVSEQTRIVVKGLPQGDEVGALPAETCGDICRDATGIAVSEAGKHLLIAGRANAKLFRLEGRSYVPTGIECALASTVNDGFITAIALSPDARLIGVISGEESNEQVTSIVRIDFVGGKCEDVALDAGQIVSPESVVFGADSKSVAVGGRDFRTKRMGFAGLWLLPDLAQESGPQPQRLDVAAEVLVEGSVGQIAVGQIPFGDGTARRLAAQISEGKNQQISVWDVTEGGLQEVARIPGGERSLLGFLNGGLALLIYDTPTKQVFAWPLRGSATWEDSTYGEQTPRIALGGSSNKLVTSTWRSVEGSDAPRISVWPAPGSPPLDKQWSRETWNLADVSPEIQEGDFALSPEGKYVLVELKNNMGSIIDIQAKKPIATVSLSKGALITALGPEARFFGYVEQSDRGDSVILVDPTGREGPRTKVFNEKIGALAFSENGQHMVVAVGADEAITTVVRLKLDGLVETARFNVDKPIATVAMNGDGTLIAVAGKEVLASKSAVRVWQVPLPSVLGFFARAAAPTLTYEVQAAESIESVALSRDGTQLATASMPESGVHPHLVLQIWTFSQDVLVREACRRIGRDFTQQEWATYLPGEPYKQTCTRWQEPSPTSTSR
jgi:WD40 repeat protein